MKIFSSDQTGQIDTYTIEHEPIQSIDLMERASNVFVDFLVRHVKRDQNILIVAGSGNNGGDALAIARILISKGYQLQVILCLIGNHLSKDCAENYKRLKQLNSVPIVELHQGDTIPDFNCTVIIDGIFGSGLNRPVNGCWGELIHKINSYQAKIFSIDIPSGLFADQATNGTSIHADYTFSFEFPKYAFMFPQNYESVGEWSFGSIGLSKEIQNQLIVNNYYVDETIPREILKPRKKFHHKGIFGHASLIGGSRGKIGAMILAGRACLKSGAGLLSMQVPEVGYVPIQSNFPEAMIYSSSGTDHLNDLNSDQMFSSFGIGCGMGQEQVTVSAFRCFLEKLKIPIVLDADALNIIAANMEMFEHIPQHSILTPHPKEFERMFGPTVNEFARNELQRKASSQYGVYIILKGAHSCISTPGGNCYFNSTGNPGMATAGSGDVLTGILTSLLAQGYSSLETCILGVYIHGMAGDLAAKDIHCNSIIASDIVNYISPAYKSIDS